MNDISVIGIDIAKSIFHLVGVDERGQVILKKKLIREKVNEFIAQQKPVVVAMEACGGSHYWGREFKKYGHEVRLIAPQFVKPFVKSNKNDMADAEAICEASLRPTMRFVPIKRVEQLELQHLHRARERMIRDQVALGNEIRGFMAEYGIVFPKGLKALRQVPAFLERYSDKMTSMGRELITELYNRYFELREKIDGYDKKLKLISRQHPVCARLDKIRAVGPVISTAVVATVADPSVFKNGRQFAAWLGIVPKQDTTGGKPRLLGISKRGDRYLRKQLIHGARSLLYSCQKKSDPFSVWATALLKRRGWNKAAVAIANKNARIIWALLHNETEYNPEHRVAV